MVLACIGIPIGLAAQGTCGAAGGPPAGPSGSVCDYAREATAVPPTGPAAGVGNPIDLITGNKYRHELDFRSAATVPLVFARHYNSRNRHAGPLGIGWSHGFETRLAQVGGPGGGTLQLVQGDGRRIVFERDAARKGRWRTVDVTQGTVERAAGTAHRWTWRRPGGPTLQFDAAGRIAAVLHAGRTVQRVGYDDRGRLFQVTGRHAVTLEFDYLAHPQGERLERVSAAGNEVARFSYDDTGQLSSVTWPDGRSQHYVYADPLDPLLLTGVLARASTTANPPSPVANYAYDTQGRAVRTTESDRGKTLALRYHPPAHEGEAGLTIVTDTTGRSARYRWTYDRRRHVARLLDAEGEACDGCPPAARRYRWDAAGRLTRIEGPGAALSLEYDAVGRPATAWLAPASGGPRELLWRVAYAGTDPTAEPASIEQPSVAPGRMHRIAIRRDRAGRMVALDERGFTPALHGRIPTFAPISRRFLLGHADDLAGEPGGPPFTAAWPSRLAWVDGPEPGPADRIRIDTRSDGLTLTHPDGQKEWMRFREDLLFEHRSAGGQFARMTHDSPAERWLGGPTLVAAFTGPRQIDLDYTDTGTLSGVILTDFEQGRRVAVHEDDPAPPTAHRVLTWWRGRPTAVGLQDGSVFRRGFDDFGRVAWIDEPGAPRQWAGYDASDRLVRHLPGDGSVLRHRRDASGRLIASTRTSAAGVTVLGRYRWAGARLIEASNEAVSVRYRWDALGRLEAAEHLLAAAPESPLIYRWHYDLASRVSAETLPGGIVVRYAYAGREVIALDVDGLASPASRIDADALREPLALREHDAGDAAADTPARVDDARFEGGRLVSAAGIRHIVDPHGRRAVKRPADASGPRSDLSFVHQDWRLRTERDAGGKLRHWLWADARPVALIDGGRLLRIVTDGRGAPVRAIDAEGRIAWSARYDRNGAALVAPGARVELGLRLPGQYYDAETGWHDNHWRSYDPSSGRYLQPDPLGLQPGYTGRDSLTAYADGDPISGVDPWGLARLSWFALTTGSDGRSLGRVQGLDRARWSFLIEDILPVPLTGNGLSRPQPAGIDGLLFDPWGDFIAGTDTGGPRTGNGLDTVAWTGTTGREVFAAFAAHYGGALASPERFVVEGFDDRRAGALALILSASPSQRRACVASVLGSLPGPPLGPAQAPLVPGAADPTGPPRLLACRVASTLPVRYRDDLERERVERLQAAAELQESPSASLGENCAASNGCRTRAGIVVDGRAYHASYGRTQFTVTTFLAELMRLTATDGGSDAAALRAAVGLGAPVLLEGRDATVADALGLARRRVDAAYRVFPVLRNEFGRGLDPSSAAAVWERLPQARRIGFTQSTGLDRERFADMLGYVASGVNGRTEEEGRHALAAAAAATVRFTPSGQAAAVRFDEWLVALFASRDPYDHLSRAFLRDNLRRVLAAPQLADRLANTAPEGSEAWAVRQREIERDIAQRVAVLHNAGRPDLALRPDLNVWLTSNSDTWIGRYVEQFIRTDIRGNWDALRCADGIGDGRALQFSTLTAMPEPTPTSTLAPRSRRPPQTTRRRQSARPTQTARIGIASRRLGASGPRQRASSSLHVWRAPANCRSFTCP